MRYETQRNMDSAACPPGNPVRARTARGNTGLVHQTVFLHTPVHSWTVAGRKDLDVGLERKQGKLQRQVVQTAKVATSFPSQAECREVGS